MEISKTFTSDQYTASYTVNEQNDGKRLDQFLMNFLPNFSRQNIKKKITSGDIRIEGRPYPHKPSTKVYEGERVTLITKRDNLEDEYWRGELIELEEPEVVYEDEDIIVIMKPPFMMAHPSGKHLFNCATVYFETRYGHTIHSIHRLDRETSGVMVLAKNPKAANEITPLFEEKKVQKVYFFIAHKKYQQKEFPFSAKERLGQIEGNLPRQFMHCFPYESDRGKSAHTDFDILEENDDYVLGLAYPKTGRQHQIRSHAHFHGMSLLGDKMYNSEPTVFMRFKDEIALPEDYDTMQIPRHALHALAITFPYKGEDKLFISPLSKDLKDWIANFGGFKCTIDLLTQNIENKITKHLKLLKNSEK